MLHFGDELRLIEVRWHGRGGQGAWTASMLLASSALLEGKHVQSFPEFGPERMGAPVTAFTRISEKPIKKHCAVYNPSVVAVLDPTLLKAVPITQGLIKGGTIVVNSTKTPSEIRKIIELDDGLVYTLPATEIAIKYLGLPITNTAMLGAVSGITKIVSLESIELFVKKRFRSDIAEKNLAVIKEAYRGAKAE